MMEGGKAVLSAFFHIISFMTSTGFGADDYTSWSPAAILLLIIVGYLGGCTGSTAGGNKTVRNIIGFKVLNIQMKRLIHPNGSFAIKYNCAIVDPSVRDATMAFLLLSTLATLILTLTLMTTGLDFLSAFSAVSSCLNVLGPAFGTLGSNFAPVSDTGVCVLSFAMLLGRLEFFTLLVLFSPRFWSS